MKIEASGFLLHLRDIRSNGVDGVAASGLQKTMEKLGMGRPWVNNKSPLPTWRGFEKSWIGSFQLRNWSAIIRQDTKL